MNSRNRSAGQLRKGGGIALTVALAVAALTGVQLTTPAARAASQSQEWAEIQAMLSGITDAYTAPPALDSVVTGGYTAGLLLGNGDLEVTSDARDDTQSYYLARSDFWDSSKGQLPFGRITIRSPRDTTGTAVATVKDTLECSASCAIDGDPQTRWVSSSNASAAAPQWVTVDLGSAKKITRWVVRHNGYPSRAANYQALNTRDFALQSSSDGTVWSTVDTVTGNSAESTDRTVPAFTARYVRLNITAAVQDPASANQKAFIRDLQLFDGSTNVIQNAGGIDPNYRQQQDILDAELHGTLTVGGQRVNTRTWPADGEDLLVTELWTDPGAARIPVQVDLTVPAGGTTGVPTAGQVWITRTTGADGAAGWVSKAAASAKVLGSPTTVTASTPSGTDARLAFDLVPGSHVLLLTSLQGNGSYSNPTVLSTFTTRATNRISGLDGAAVGSVHTGHLNWWRTFWLKSYVDTGNATMNKFYYGALYAVGAANRTGFFPGGTYSPWRTQDASGGNGRYWLNYNTEAQYFGVYSANRPELADPYYRVIQAEIPYQRNRTHAAGYQGVTFGRVVTPLNTTRPAPATIPVAPTRDYHKLPSDQQTNGTYAALPFLWDWEYTGDLNFFRTVTYPLLKELGAFWTDFVVKNPSTGRYEILHSGVNEGGDDVNSVYDLGYLRRVLTALIDGSTTLGVDANLRPVWRDVLNNLTTYPTATMNGLNVILLASKINNSIKGNALLNKNDQPINLEGVVFPSDNLAIGGDPAMLQLVRNTLEWVNPFLPGSRGSSINGFPKTFPIAARAGWDPQDLIDKFTTVINNLWRPNLTVRQGGGGQETSGAIETVDSMFLQTYQGVTRVFADWPAARNAKFVRLRAKGSFLVSSQLTGGTVGYVDVTSEQGNRLILVNPWGGTPPKVVDSAGQKVAYTTSGGTISFPTTAGQTYHITT